jgi:uncharacterized membrane protein YfcA
MEIYLVIGGLGLVTGFLSGLLGIGGGIVMAPLLLYLPPLFGLAPLSMRVVAGLTIVQGLLGCLASSVAHSRFRFVAPRLSAYMGTAIFATAMAGGAASRFVSNEILLFLFACLAMSACLLMLVPVQYESERPDLDTLSFSTTRAVTAASGVGILGGLVGQGGSFILIPLMTAYVRIPTRIAIGSNLAIVLLSSFAGFLGKALTGQIEWLMTIPLVLTAVPGAWLGSSVSQRVPVKGLRRILALLIGLAAIRIWVSLVL